MMDSARQHWKILQELDTDLANRVRSFMVFSEKGEGMIVVTESGEGYWMGTMKFVWVESKTVIRPTLLNVSNLDCMAHGRRHILLLNKRGELYSMGENNSGQLGLGTVDQEIYFTPQLISTPHKFIFVRCGISHSLALTEDGKVWAWGGNDFGKVGVSSSTANPILSPRQILELDLHRVVAVECGGLHSLALTDQGEVYAWGLNDWGQLGDGSKKSTHTPTRIPIPSPVQSMAAGHSHTLLLTQTGEVWSCGYNKHGQLGFPTTTESNPRLSMVTGLPSISQITSHFSTQLSIAMSFNQRCFVWGYLCEDKLEKKYISVFTPLKLPPFYSTVESPLSFFSNHRSTQHSIQVSETPPSPLSARMSRMFDNPETSPDVQFVVDQRTIHAHRIILSNSSDYFARMFSERLRTSVNPEDPIVKVTIPDHSYQVFHAFLRFLYTDCFKVHLDFLSELFELANQYLESDLQQLCISRMRTTITPTTCCLYYPLTHRHSLLPELATFQQELVKFASTRISEITAAFHLMEPDLRENLVSAVQNFLGT